jgi:hypothetical protein
LSSFFEKPFVNPRYGEQYVLPFDYEPEKDDGMGL